MNCHAHSDTTAVAVCRTCSRGVCKSCAHENEFHITCSVACEHEAFESHKMLQISKRIYGIGVTKRPLPLITVMMGGMGLVFVLWSVTIYWYKQELDGFTIVFGGFCLAIALLSYWRSKKLGVSC